MSLLIAIDPGAWSVAWAAFERGALTWCGLERAAGRPQLAEKLRSRFAGFRGGVSIEIPQIYLQRKWKGDPNDMIAVAFTVGMLLQLMPEAKLVKPRDWKGTTPKNVHNRRTLSLLDEAERDVLGRCGAPKSHRHNVVDAIGIGLWQLKRQKMPG